MGIEIVSNQMEDIVEQQDPEFSDSVLVSCVREALISVSDSGFENYTDNYSQLIRVFSNKRLDADEVAELVASLKALTRTVSYIDIDCHSSLLSSIFGMSMWNYSPDVMDALVELIKTLAVSNGKFVRQCLDMLVLNFMPPHSFLQFLSHPRGISRKEQVLVRVHSALNDIADLVPITPILLNFIVPQYIPHMMSKNVTEMRALKIFLEKNEIYVENMLRLESGVLGKYLRRQMLSEVVYRLVELDVEIEWDEILQDDPSKGIFDMELEDIDEDAEYDENDTDLPKPGFGLQKLGVDIFAKKLDTLMVLTCEHIKSCADEGRLVEVFETLLLSFENSILNAHKSKFAQFVMFYACSLDPENCAVRFAGLLADTFMHATSSPLTRMSAVAYVASYLSRGRFLPNTLIASTLKRLVDWCSEYCKLQETEEKRPNPLLHRVFYSGCQAVMYVLCFRMRWMMDVPHLKSQLLQMRLEQILRSPLDPLKVCLPSIVTEFVRQAKAAKLFTVSDNIFNNVLESDLSMTYGGIERLDMFFPFDPCLLKNCDRYIRPNFLYWSMVKTTYDDNEGSDSDSSDEDVNVNEGFVDGNSECFLDDTMGRSLDDRELELDFDEFENSMNKMSITPKTSSKNRFPGGVTLMPARIRPSTSPESL